jgi:2-hydroxy-6-oxonona-2,4-dienedioate hydrolase
MPTDTPELTRESTARELATSQGILRYHEAGEGPPLVLLHGSGPGVTGWRNFSGNLATLAARFRCLVLEFPGYGVSDPTDEHPMRAAGPAVTRFLDGLGIERADIIGNSMGGIVAAQVAMARPDRVRRLVTIGGIGTNLLSPAPGEGIRLLMEFTDDPTRERLIQWLQSMVYDPALVTEEMVEERWAQATEPGTLASARRMYGKAAFAAGQAAMTASPAPPYWAMLHKLAAPTLITWGRDDRVSPVDMALLPMRLIPRAELHVFPNCGHWVMIEQKAAWESAVLAFLARPGRTPDA